MMQNDWKVGLAWLAVVVLCLPCGAASERGEYDSAARELGETVGREVESGFVFFEGRYIEAPYSVSRRGTGVFINSVMVKKWTEWPLPDFTVEDDPGQPQGLTEDSNLDDIRTGHAARKYRYLHQHFPEEIAVKKMAEYYARLPFVETVVPERPGHFGTLVIAMKNGDLELVDVTRPPPDSVSSGHLTQQDVINSLEEARRDYEDRLEKGDCFFFFAKGAELSFGKAKAARDLRLITEILRSKRADGAKIALLERLSVLPPADDVFYSLATEFQAADQLVKRIDALIEASGTVPRGLDEIPIIPPVIETRLIMIKRARREAQEDLRNEKNPRNREEREKHLERLKKEERQLEDKVRYYRELK